MQESYELVKLASKIRIPRFLTILRHGNLLIYEVAKIFDNFTLHANRLLLQLPMVTNINNNN